MPRRLQAPLQPVKLYSMENEPKKTQTNQAFQRQSEYNVNSRRWMWLGVTILGSIILVIWLWSMKLQMTFFDWKKTPESTLIENTKKNWNEIFEENKKDKDTLETAKEEIKNLIMQFNRGVATTTILNTNTSTITTTSR